MRVQMLSVCRIIYHSETLRFKSYKIFELRLSDLNKLSIEIIV